MENTELYSIFPYRIFGLNKPNIEIAKTSYTIRKFTDDIGWEYQSIQAAYLGLSENAAQSVLKRFSTKHPGSRFDAFWGPNYDWIPDQDHGNVAVMALQKMLIQSDGDNIILFPAWPEEWDVQFKLFAPSNTIIEGNYQNKKMTHFSITPETRKSDVTINSST
jgi:hypothetical protein